MFERLTDRARRVLVLAQHQAFGLGSTEIGTEHLLLGVVAEGEGVGAVALDALGVEFHATRAKVVELAGERPAIRPAGDMEFTPRAKKVLELSLREALQLGHNYIGTEHILLALIREGEGVAAQVLVKLGADLSRVRQMVVQILSGYDRSPLPPKPVSGETAFAVLHWLNQFEKTVGPLASSHPLELLRAELTAKPDEEAITRALEPLSPAAQRRVLSYLADALADSAGLTPPEHPPTDGE